MARHGKDTTAKFLQDALQEKSRRVLVAHFGDLVKYVCQKFFGWNGEKDEAGRTLLQQIGTDRVRAQDENYWVRFLAEILTMFPDQWDYVLIPDCRFPNEISCLKDAGLDILHVRVVRPFFVSPLTQEQQNHPSETALDSVTPDVLIYNEGDLDALRNAALDLLDHLEHGDIADNTALDLIDCPERGDIADESPSLRQRIEEEKPSNVDLFGNLSPHWTTEGVQSVIEKYFLHDCSKNLFRFTDDDWAVCTELGLTLDEVCAACAEFRFQKCVDTLEQFFADTTWTADMPTQDAIQQVKDFYRWRNQQLPHVREIFQKHSYPSLSERFASYDGDYIPQECSSGHSMGKEF